MIFLFKDITEKNKIKYLNSFQDETAQKSFYLKITVDKSIGVFSEKFYFLELINDSKQQYKSK